MKRRRRSVGDLFAQPDVHFVLGWIVLAVAAILGLIVAAIKNVSG